MNLTVQGVESPDQVSLFADSQQLAIGHFRLAPAREAGDFELENWNE